jgi:hypothetical protein
MASKKSRQTFEKLKREQAVREKRARKLERKEAARTAKALGLPPPGSEEARLLEEAQLAEGEPPAEEEAPADGTPLAERATAR